MASEWLEEETQDGYIQYRLYSADDPDEVEDAVALRVELVAFIEANARAEAVAEWREAVREDAPVDWDCSHCGMTRSVVIRFDEDGLAPASLNPSCPGYITCEAGGFSHPDDNSCSGPDGASAWCPFDAADEYGTGDLEAVMAVRRERARLRALLEDSQEEGD